MVNIANVSAWFSAFRLRTLPLAVASISLGSFLAAAEDSFQWQVSLLALLTAFLLQILSNLANDYGDSVHGADSERRVGPQRATQSGRITSRLMRAAVLVLVGLCLASGYLLIRGESYVFHVSGLAAIAAAVAYTVGPRPYGYVGLGDLFVFLFFGIVGVCGSYYLHTHRLNLLTLLPAVSCGVFCVAVLNINNLRDMTSDQLAGKITMAVRLGGYKARIYHWILLLVGLGSASAYIFLTYKTAWQWLFLAVVPLLLRNGRGIFSQQDATLLDPYLKQMALTTLLFSFLFGAGMLL